VPDDDADHVAVAACEVDRGFDLAIVAVGVLVDPDAERDLETEFGGDRRHHLNAAGRRIEPDRARDGRELLHGGGDLFRAGDIVHVGMFGSLERCVGYAGQHAVEIRSLQLLLENAPECGMDGADKQQNSYDGTHRYKTSEERMEGTRTRPLGSTTDDNAK